MNDKATLKLYREEKLKIEETKWFRNGHRFSIMMQARSNSLPLGWRAFRADEEKLCKVCNQGEVETLEHFLLKCVPLQQTRSKYIYLQLPRQEDETDILKTMLLLRSGKEISNLCMINCIAELWRARNKIIDRV